MQIHFSTHTCRCDVTLGFQWVLHSVWSIQNPVSHVGRRDGLLLGRWKKKKKYPQTRRFCHSLSPPIGFSGGSGSKESAPCRRPRFNPWVGKIPWRWKWQPTPVFLLGESHGWRTPAGYSPQGRKESDTTEQLHFTLSGFQNCKCTVVREGENKPAVGWWQEPGNQQGLILSLSLKECAPPC